MCRCDFLCSKAVVQFVCWDVCVVFCFVLFFVLFLFLILGGLGCFRVGVGEAYVVVLRLGGVFHGEYSSKEVHSLLALAAMVPVSGVLRGVATVLGGNML